MDFAAIRSKTEALKDDFRIKEISNRDIAIIGVSARFPNAQDLDRFWCNLENGVDCIGEFPVSRRLDTDQFLKYQSRENTSTREYLPGAYLQEIDSFDCSFFRLSPKEASLMSPNQRLFLETAWHAIEDAGYGGKKLIGSNTGVYVGFEADAPYDYKRFIAELDPESISMAVPGNLTPIIASRISYLLDFHGPSLSVDTACSASLVAVHLACQGIRNGECDLALAGSVRINLLPVAGQVQLGVESSDGRAHSFDDSADGTGSGEGVAAVLLKPLSKALKDNDQIYAVIKGSAVNQDGSSIGITAPNVLAQEKVICSAWKDGGIDPETISYIEAHGTGTRLGDPIEIDGLQRAFRKFTDKKQFCALGTVKTNLGHLDNAAGIAGLIKTILALRAKKIPPLLHFQRPNRQIRFEQSPVYVNDRLRDWEANGQPRRCGISSFGFSGTNCHLVMEEAPVLENRPESDTLEILTLSAKSKEALQRIIGLFKSYIAQEHLPDPADICYTANTGRGHYNYRLALIVSGKTDLTQKILQIGDLNPQEVSLPGVYYGEHRVVSSGAIQTEAGAITESDIKILTQKAQAILKAVSAGAAASRDCERQLIELCALYIQGADINWEELYDHQIRHKVSLPVYPFERKRCWIQPNQGLDSPSKRMGGAKTGWLLLDRCLVQSLDLEIYGALYSAAKYWVVNEHQIMDHFVLVGAAYLEMALEAVQPHLSAVSGVEFADVVFLTPLILQREETREIQLLLKRTGAGFEFFVISQPAPGSWLRHVEGKIRVVDLPSRPELAIQAIKSKLGTETIIPDIDQFQIGTPFRFGPHWKNIQEMYVGDGEILSYLELPEVFRGETSGYRLHPSMLDNALTALPLLEEIIGAKPAGGEDVIFLPLSYQKIRLYAPLPEKFFSWVKLKEPLTPKTEVARFDVVLMDLCGVVLVVIEGYALKKTDPNQSIQKLTLKNSKNLCYRLGWVPEELAAQTLVLPPGNILVLKDGTGLGDELVRRLKSESTPGNAIIFETEFGPAYQKMGAHQYRMGGTEPDYELLWADLQNHNIGLIIHLQSITNRKGPANIEELAESQTRGVKSLFYLTRQILKNKRNHDIHIVVITKFVHEVTGQEEVIIPENATLFGLGKVIGQEYPSLNCKCIDIDSKTTMGEILAELGEFQAKQVAYRNGRRYLAEFQRLNIGEIPAQTITLKNEGVYLITGGSGGIGLEIAKYLALQNKINLALIQRSKLPERQDWEEILQTGADLKLCRKLRMIREIEALGSRVECASADVSSYETMKQSLALLRHKFGRINGIIHGAGIAGNGFLINKEEIVFDQVMAPKVTGTWILDQLTQDDPLDFLMLFSSVTTLTGAPGQGDYTAANAYQDSYAAYRNKRGGRTLVINWAGWLETGMAFDYGVKPEGFFHLLSTTDAIAAFNQVIHRSLNQVIIGAINENNAPDPFAASYLKMAPELAMLYRSSGFGNNLTPQRENLPHPAKVKLLGQKDGKYSATEQTLAQIFSEILGLETVNIYDSFYDFGGDSLIGMKVIDSVNQRMKTKLDIADLLGSSDLKSLAASIDETYFQKTGRDWAVEIPKTNENAYYPLSSAQKRIFILNQYEGISTTYNMPRVMLLEGNVILEQLENALRMLINRHEILRTSFAMVEETPVQIIHPAVDFQLEYVELAVEKVDPYIAENIRPFQLEIAPLLRVKLAKIAAGKFLLIFDIHHIISDGKSMNILTRELIQLYQGFELPELGIQYKDYAAWQSHAEAWQNHADVWQRSFSDTERLREQAKYWTQVFQGEIPLLNLTTDYARPPLQDFTGTSLKTCLDEGLSSGLQKLAAETGTTLFMIFLAAINVLLHRYTGQDDIIIGSPVEGRTHPDLENLIGVFINNLALRNNPQPELSFQDFLATVKENALNAYRHQDYPFEELYNQLQIHRDLSRNPLFDVMINFQTIPAPEFAIGDIRVVPYPIIRKTAMFDLTFHITFHHEILEVTLEYCVKLFREETMARFFGHFINILECIVREPGRKLTEINLLSPREIEYLLYKVNDRDGEYPKTQPIQQLFFAQAQKTPEETAIEYEGNEWSYAVVNQQADQIAIALRQKGAAPNEIIGVIAKHSPETVIGILGILKAGAAYLPIDPEYPAERIKYLLEDSGVRILLNPSGELEIPFGGEFLWLDKEQPELSASLAAAMPAPLNQGADLAYVIYTSGTTGKPKGVAVTHQGLVNYIWWAKKVYLQERPLDFPLYSSLTFDLTVTSMYTPLIAGRRMIIYQATDKALLLPKILADNRAGILKLTPTHLRILAELNPGASKLQVLIVGGEDLSADLAQKVHDRFGGKIEIYNEYGPTETVVGCMIYRFNPEKQGFGSVPIGIPADNTQIYLLDQSLNPMPQGAAGEIYISGAGVARGYLNQPALSRERFLDNPFVTGTKMYKSGDLAKWTSDGQIIYLGRTDHQVKIRGFRIELEEIESQLRQYPGVKEAVVLARKDANGIQSLYAYLTVVEELAPAKLADAGLRTYLAQQLPDYMIPVDLIQLDELPLTANGKLDREALPKPGGLQTRRRKYIAPRDEVEEKLAAIFKCILGTDTLGIHDHFFESGGDSLKATILSARIAKEFNIEIPLRQVFQYPFIADLAEYIRQAARNLYSRIPSIHHESNLYPVSAAQKRLFIIQQFGNSQISYNLPGAVLITGNLHKERVVEVFQKLIHRHESLRTSFELMNGLPVQRIHQQVELEFSEADWEAQSGPVPQEENDGLMDQRILEMIYAFIQPFDLSKAPLFRVKLLHLNQKRSLLFFDMHHIISDGFSMRIFINEFYQLYRGEKLPKLRIQYKDYSAWKHAGVMQNEAFQKQKDYWLQRFSGEVPVLEMHTDFPRPAQQSFEGSVIRFELNHEVTQKIAETARQNGATLYMVLLALYNVVFAKYTGQEDIVIGSALSGRSHADLENIIGIFVNTLAMRNQPAGNKVFSDFLGEVKENTLAAFENQDYQFEQLVEELALKRDLSRNPLFDVVFTLQSFGANDPVQIGEVTFTPYPFDSTITKFDLTLFAEEKNGALLFTLEYCAKLFKAETVRNLAGHFCNLVAHVADHPNAPISELEILSDAEKRLVFLDFNDTFRDYPSNQTIHQLFESQAATTPDAIALVFEEERLTYSHLNKRSNQLAKRLRAQGVGGGSIVGIVANRSLKVIAGIIAILKAGGVYLPLEPSYPRQRLEYIIGDSNLEIILTEEAFLTKVPSTYTGVLISLDDPALESVDTSSNDNINSPHSPAYLIYTSGTTGQPKGVMIQHQNVIRLVKNTNYIAFKDDDRILQTGALVFDASTFEIWGSLLNGLQLHLVAEEIILDAKRLEAVLAGHKITILWLTAPLFNQLAQQKPEIFLPLRILLVGGDVLSPSHIRLIRNTCKNLTLINGYGPTENTTFSTCFSIAQDYEKSIPIGKPIANSTAYILNNHHQLQPVGVVGELYVGGAGVGRGYLNQPELTAEKFVGVFRETPQQMYRTGDLARWLPDGNIEFLGRKDQQVKIRGFRIELEEIETHLVKYPFIKEAVVVFKKNEQTGSYLCAYVVGDENIQPKELRQFLSEQLPDYMIPAYFIKLDKIPLTQNGKVNKVVLPEPNASFVANPEYTAPANPIEEKLAELWAAVLDLSPAHIGVNDNFFEIGGNSLLVIRLHALLKDSYPGVTVADLFAYPTIKELNAFISLKQTLENEAAKPENRFIPMMSWPKEYFTNSEASALDDGVFELHLPPDLSDKLHSQSSRNGIPVKNLLLSLFIYLLTEITAQPDIILQTMVTETDKIRDLKLNLADISDFKGLFGLVAQELESPDQSEYQFEAIIPPLNRAKNQAILIFVYESRCCSRNLNFNRIFDLILQLSIEASISLRYEYNRDLLNEAKMKHLFEEYGKVIQTFAAQRE